MTVTIVEGRPVAPNLNRRDSQITNIIGIWRLRAPSLAPHTPRGSKSGRGMCARALYRATSPPPRHDALVMPLWALCVVPPVRMRVGLRKSSGDFVLANAKR